MTTTKKTKTAEAAGNGKFAVIKTGGKQYIVKTGDMLEIEKLEGLVGDKVTFNEVLMIVEGDNVQIGKPTLAGATVSATIKEQDRNDKVVIIRYKAKTRQHKKRGHRQPFTKVEIGTV